MVFDIRKYVLERLHFPKLVVFDKPGMILHKKKPFFGGKEVVTRTIFVFEEVYSDLFINTLKEIGVHKASELWYRIGKEVALRYLGFYNGFRRNESNIKKMLNYFSKHFSGAGMSAFDNYNCDFDKGKFYFSGSNSVICRNFFNASYLAGALSGMITFLFQKNVEAEYFCKDCPNGCSLVADFSFPDKCIVSDDTLKRNSFVALVKMNHPIKSTLSSFYDFLRFGIVKIDNSNKFSFKDKTIIPVEIGLPMIFHYNYMDYRLSEIYEKSIIKSSERLSKELFSNQKDVQDKISAVRNISSAFGWGEPFILRQGNSVKVSFLNPFFLREKPGISQYFFNGFLNYLYGQDFYLKSIGESGIVYSLKES